MACAGDVGNAFRHAKCKEKVFVIAGPEFGPELACKWLIIYKASHGLQTSAPRFHEHLSVFMQRTGFKPSKADPDLWIRKLRDGKLKCVAGFVDNIIAFSNKPVEIMDKLKSEHVMKKGAGKPQCYLGRVLST
jgi:hypothetical protein